MTVSRPYPRSGPCFVVCRGDGKMMSAGIDVERWPHEGGLIGYGMTLADALRDLAEQLDAEVGYNHKEGESCSSK